ncbi:oxidation resistance protein 1 isoform X2 [Coregonus clupeaformis]|nr:oxidation resistance protein 1 isoform X2 [Coregonus clupeaformis]
MSFQRPKGTVEYSDSDDIHRRDSTPSPAHPMSRPARVVLSTSEEEEALTQKFLKINCKYITDGKGVVSGVLLVTPNNLMFEPHKADPLVQDRGCEEYGIMCPLEEVMSAAMCTEVTDSRIKEFVPPELELLSSAPEPCHMKRVPWSNLEDAAQRARDAGNDSASTTARSTEDSPVRDDPGSSDELRRDKSSGASPESDQTINQAQDSELAMEELRKLWKSHIMQSANEQGEGDQQEAKTANQDQSEEGTGKALPVPKEKRRQRSHKFLCLQVGKPMKKTFVSHASASMQQYAQRNRKHEYWFAVPHERSDHLYAFFVQWSPDMYREDMGGRGASGEPGFVVVKNNWESETGSDVPPGPDITAKEWEIITKREVNSKHGPAIRTDLEPEVFRPNLSKPSDLLQMDQIEKLAKNLPPRTIGYHWSLAFSTNKHGMSIKTLYRAMQGLDTPVLMVIKDSDGHMFGALASEPFKVSDSFYGTGETFLFTFCPDFEVFKWTGDNMFFLKGDMDSLAFGGGGGEFGLWLDGDLYHGRSKPCKTFGNPMLTKTEDFVLQDIEIWSFE